MALKDYNDKYFLSVIKPQFNNIMTRAVLDMGTLNGVGYVKRYDDIEYYNTTYNMWSANSSAIPYGGRCGANDTGISNVQYAYDNTFFSDIGNVAYYLELGNALELVDLIPTTQIYYHQRSAELVEGVDTITNKDAIFTRVLTKNEFIEQYSDYVYIKNILGYDNSNDGNITEESPRTILPNQSKSWSAPGWRYMPCLRFHAGKVAKNGQWVTGDYDGLLNIFDGMYNSAASFVQDSNSVLYTQEYPRWGSVCFYATASQDFIFPQTPGGSVRNLASQFVIFKKDYIKTLLSWGQIPWTDNIDEILYKNSDYFETHVDIGQPDSKPDGGDGDGDNTSDDITIVSPGISALNGFNRVWAMNQTQLHDLNTYLWDTSFIDDIKKFFNEPAESIVSCMLYPFDLSAQGVIGNVQSIKIGNITTTVNGRLIPSNYNSILDMGSFQITEYFGSALDYNPYTKISIYLPYLGFKDLNVNDVMGRTINVKYALDILSGCFVALIWADNQLMYSYSGKMGVEIPISSSNWTQVSAGLTMGLVSSASTLGMGIATGNPIVAGAGLLSMAKSVTGSQIHIDKGSVATAQSGLYAPQYCYLIITRPVQSKPADFEQVAGYPSNITRPLSQIQGYTEISDILIEDMTATDTEKEEIKTLLEQGVIFN